MESQPPPLDYGTAAGRTPLAAAARWAVVGAVGFLVGLIVVSLIPANGIGRPEAERARCASNLREIGLTIQAYCDAHGGAFPGTLADLATSGDGLDPTVLVCPASTDTPATLPVTTAPTTRQVIAALAVPGHVSYVYCGLGWRDRAVPPDAVVAYEPLSHHGTGSNVLFGNGHVEWVATPRAARLIAAAAATTRPVSAATVP